MFTPITWQTVLLFTVFGITPLALHHYTYHHATKTVHVGVNILWVLPLFLTLSYLTNQSPFVHAMAVLSLIIICLRIETSLLLSTILTTTLLLAIPTKVTIFSTVLGLEFASVITTALALYLLGARVTKHQLTDLLYPLLVYNFLTYILLLTTMFIYFNSPVESWASRVTLPNLVFCYILLKVTITPLLLAKTPLYNYLTVASIMALTLPQLSIALPQIINIHVYLIPLHTATIVPLYVMTMSAMGYNLSKVTNARQLLMYSTPLFVTPLIITILV